VSLSASKGTAQIITLCVARMGKEEDPAMPASGQEGPQVRLVSQDGPQDAVVPQDETPCLAQAVPPRAELEVLLEPYEEKPRVSLMILMYCFTALVLPNGLNAVER